MAVRGKIRNFRLHNVQCTLPRIKQQFYLNMEHEYHLSENLKCQII